MSCGHPSTRFHVYYHNPSPPEKAPGLHHAVVRVFLPAPMLLQSLSFIRFIPHFITRLPFRLHFIRCLFMPPGHHIFFIFLLVMVTGRHRALLPASFVPHFGSRALAQSAHSFASTFGRFIPFVIHLFHSSHFAAALQHVVSIPHSSSLLLPSLYIPPLPGHLLSLISNFQFSIVNCQLSIPPHTVTAKQLHIPSLPARSLRSISPTLCQDLPSPHLDEQFETIPSYNCSQAPDIYIN
jgi:hypothetical protein